MKRTKGSLLQAQKVRLFLVATVIITKLIHYGLCMIASPKLDNPEEAPTNEIWVQNEKWCAFIHSALMHSQILLLYNF